VGKGIEENTPNPQQGERRNFPGDFKSPRLFAKPRTMLLGV
jgi:hypothetical protein